MLLFNFIYLLQKI